VVTPDGTIGERVDAGELVSWDMWPEYEAIICGSCSSTISFM